MLRGILLLLLLHQGTSEAVMERPAPRKTVLLTSFQGVAGNPLADNASQTVARLVREKMESDPSIDLRVCELPVAYEKASEAALECFQQIHPRPSLVLSLGEAGCKLSFLVGAQNEIGSGSGPDQAGMRAVTNFHVQQDGPAWVPMGMDYARLFCAADGAADYEDLIAFSLHGGAYVCNSTAYRLGTAFRSMNVPYGFAHVPTPYATCGTDRTAMLYGKNVPFRDARTEFASGAELQNRVIRSAELIARMIKTAFREGPAVSGPLREPQLLDAAPWVRGEEGECRVRYRDLIRAMAETRCEGPGRDDCQ